MRFIDIATIVHDIHDDMNITERRLAPIIILGGSNSFEEKIKQYYKKEKIEINVYSTQPIDDKTYGLYTRYNKKNYILFDIDINASLNNCWTRFVTAKELAHTILDKNSSSYTENILSLIDMLITESPQIKIDNDLHSEYLAFVFAIELLIPFAMNAKIIDTNISSYQIAESLKVPEKMIDFVRTDWYQKLRKKAYSI